MTSRRDFLKSSLKTGAVATASLAASTSLVAEDRKPLPPSIAELKSMKSLARPITADERRSRIARARELMAESKLDAIVISPGTSLVYFSDIHWWPSERFFAMVLPAKGNPFYVSPAFEEGRAREQVTRGPLGDSADVRIWQEDQDPYARLAEGLKDHGITTGRIGCEETMYYVFSSNLAKAAPAAHFESATPVTAGCRMIKSDHELELMRLANKVTLTAFEAAWKAVKPGMTDHEFGFFIEAAHDQLGFSGGSLVL